MKTSLLTLAFLLELVAFTGFSSLGLLVTKSGTFHIILIGLLFVALVAFWSIFMAPNALKKYKAREYYAAKTVIYACATVGLFHLGGSQVSALFIVVAMLDEAVLFKHNLSK